MTAPDREVVDLCRELIRIDTSNYGDDTGPGERKAAEYVAEQLTEVGLEPAMYEAAPGRASVVVRLEGSDPARTDALLIHGHLDVVPADAADWTHDPFSAELADGCIWGRGAVDMKDMDAMVLSVIRDRMQSGRVPARPIVLAFLADEEAGGILGAHWLVDHHPELFEGCTEAIGEVGGFSLSVRDDLRLYLIETAQKGIEWMRVTATGPAGPPIAAPGTRCSTPSSTPGRPRSPPRPVGWAPFYNRFYYQSTYTAEMAPEAAAFFNFKVKRFRYMLEALTETVPVRGRGRLGAAGGAGHPAGVRGRAGPGGPGPGAAGPCLRPGAAGERAPHRRRPLFAL